MVRNFALEFRPYVGRKREQVGRVSLVESSGFCSDGWKEPHALMKQLVEKPQKSMLIVLWREGFQCLCGLLALGAEYFLESG